MANVFVKGDNKGMRIEQVHRWLDDQLSHIEELYHKRKKDVILEAALLLEKAGVKQDTISTEISNRHSKYIDDSYVRKVLKDYPQFKDDKHVKSAMMMTTTTMMSTGRGNIPAT